MSTLVLASGSPRRRTLLEAAGLRFTVHPADIDETPHPAEHPARYVERLALEKASAVGRRLAGGAIPRGAAGGVAAGGTGAAVEVVVLAADTTVDVDGVSIGKPTDAEDARRILRSLSGRAHHVHTGVAVLVVGGERSPGAAFVVTTEVRFAALSAAAIDWYVGTGEPMDVAGAYALQGAGGAFVSGIAGSHSNVIGLPLVETLAQLAAAGIDVPTA